MSSGEVGQLQLFWGGSTGLPSALLRRRFRDAVLYEVRCERCCSLSVGLEGRPRPRSHREQRSVPFAVAVPTSLLDSLIPPCSFLLNYDFGSRYAAWDGLIPYNGSKSVLRFHNTCSNTDSLRATATTALRFALLPPRAANRRPQRLSAESSP